MSNTTELEITEEIQELDPALHLSRSYPAEPASINEAFVVKAQDGSEQRLGTYYFDLPEPAGRLYGAKLPSWIAQVLVAEERAQNDNRGRNLLVVLYSPSLNKVALLDELRWDGENYAYMNYIKVFSKVGAGLYFRSNDQQKLLSSSPLER